MPLFDKILNRRGCPPPYRKEEQYASVDSADDCNLVDEKAPSPTAIIYQSELDYLSRCVLDFPNIETGGQLFGFWSNQGVPVVLYAIGPGRHANHQSSFFNQDSQYLLSVGNELLNRYGLCHIGEWHSHHQLGLARPSGHDARTMHNGLVRIPQRRLLLCICNYENGRSTVNPYNFHENDLRGYSDAIWQIIERESPFRRIVDNELRGMLIHPYTSQPSHGKNRTYQSTQQSSTPQIRIPADYWVAKDGNLEVLKTMLRYTQEMIPFGNVDTQADENGIVQFHFQERGIDIRFPKAFPEESPEIYVRNKQLRPDLEWVRPNDSLEILKSYQNWLGQLYKGL